MKSLPILLAMSCLISCRQRGTGSNLKHPITATSMQPTQPLTPCTPSTSNVDANQYFAKIGRQIMNANQQNTFTDPYDPELFCFRTRAMGGVHSFANPTNRTVTFDLGLLYLQDDQVDADLAMIIAHELAHVTLQHGARIPLPTELPDDFDRAELDRRLRLKAVFVDKQTNLKKSIAVNAHTDNMYENYVWLVQNNDDIIATLKPKLKTSDNETLARVATLVAALKSSFSSIFENTKPDAVIEANFMIQSRELILTLTEEIPGVANAIKTVGGCTIPRDAINCLGQIASYSRERVQPINIQLMTNILPQDDDPAAYAPYAQWMEQQADEVGYELYLRAGFKPERAHSAFNAIMKIKSPETLEQCLVALQAPQPPNRVEANEDRKYPNACFRRYNLQIAEMAEHKNEYAVLAEKATTLNLPDTVGELKHLRTVYPAENLGN